MSREKKNQNASKRGTIETSSLRFARSKPQKNIGATAIARRLRADDLLPGVMGSTDVRPSTPNCMGVRQNTLSCKKKNVLSQNQKISDFYSPFSQQPMIVG